MLLEWLNWLLWLFWFFTVVKPVSLARLLGFGFFILVISVLRFSLVITLRDFRICILWASICKNCTSIINFSEDVVSRIAKLWRWSASSLWGWSIIALSKVFFWWLFLNLSKSIFQHIFLVLQSLYFILQINNLVLKLLFLLLLPLNLVFNTS